jgi:hypothetical protein
MSVPRIAPRRPLSSRAPLVPLLILVVVVVVLFLGVRHLFRHHENTYERLAQDVTMALQRDDVEAVKKYQNAETATLINRGIVGRAADTLAPLGKLKSVKETTAADAPAREHEFNVAFDKGTVHERLKLDPDNKIVLFKYDKVTP